MREQIAKNTSFLNKQKENTGHGDAINSNASTGATFEIRIFRGTLIHNTFKACVDFAINLIKCIQNEPIEKITFSKVANYYKNENLKNYIKERDIKANYKHLKDYAKQNDRTIKTLENKIETIKRKTKRLIEQAIDERLEKNKKLTSKNITKNISAFDNINKNIQILASTLNDINNNYIPDARDKIRYSYQAMDEQRDAMLDGLDEARDYELAIRLIR